MTKRNQLLALIKAKYNQGEQKEAMRIYIENKCISYSAYQKAISGN